MRKQKQKVKKLLASKQNKQKLEAYMNLTLETIHEGHLRLELQLKEKLNLKFSRRITTKEDLTNYANEIARRAKEGLPLFKITAPNRTHKRSTRGTATEDHISKDAGQTDIKADSRQEMDGPRSEPTTITNATKH